MDYIEVNDIKQYLKELVRQGVLTPFYAYKTATVKARVGNIGEIVNTFSDEGFHETTKTVLRNAKGELDWVISKDNGSAYVMDNDSFINDYIQGDKEGVYRSLRRDKLIIKIDRDIVFKNKAGNIFKPKAGHYIVVDDDDDFYELSPQSFEKDYKLSDRRYSYEADDTYLV